MNALVSTIRCQEQRVPLRQRSRKTSTLMSRKYAATAIRPVFGAVSEPATIAGREICPPLNLYRMLRRTMDSANRWPYLGHFIRQLGPHLPAAGGFPVLQCSLLLDSRRFGIGACPSRNGAAGWTGAKGHPRCARNGRQEGQIRSRRHCGRARPPDQTCEFCGE
jgi:hypothetical protein